MNCHSQCRVPRITRHTTWLHHNITKLYRMLLLKTLEYLFYLLWFCFLCKYVEGASVQPTEPAPIHAETLQPPQKAPSMSMNECETSPFSWMCLKIEFVKIMERLAEQQELSVLPGVSVVRDENATELKTSELMAGKFKVHLYNL